MNFSNQEENGRRLKNKAPTAYERRPLAVNAETLEVVSKLKELYGLDLGAGDSHRLAEPNDGRTD